MGVLSDYTAPCVVVVTACSSHAWQVMDIFGVSDYTTSPECIACLTDPRDTILLPCRHLCVCASCFDHLTLDRCPVCRAAFFSYLRIDANANAMPLTAQPCRAGAAAEEPPL